MALKIIKKTTNVRRRIMDIIDTIVEDYGYDCADNYRYHEVGNDEQKALYDKQVEYGCCGSCDTLIKFRGKSYMVGFNHGH